MLMEIDVQLRTCNPKISLCDAADIGNWHANVDDIVCRIRFGDTLLASGRLRALNPDILLFDGIEFFEIPDLNTPTARLIVEFLSIVGRQTNKALFCLPEFWSGNNVEPQ